MLSCLIWQLLDQLESLPACVIELRRETPTGESPDVNCLLKCLQERCSSFRAVVILLDALDEAFPGSAILDVIAQLNTLLPSSSRLLVSSRDELHIKTLLLESGYSQVMIPRSKVDRDSAAYISKRFKSDLKDRIDSLPFSLRRKIYDTLTTQSKGMSVKN